MSLLAPLYFLGALAVSLPLIFHLIRRQPKGEVEFSSLMFLKPTPPRLTRRSRLEHLPLLLIRALVLTLLAAAFARPFIRSVVTSDSDPVGRSVILLVDTSASMQRSGLWQQTLDKAREAIDELEPQDRLAVVTFDEAPTTLIGFEASSEMAPGQRSSTVQKSLADLSPTWKRTEMGRAISYAAEMAIGFEPDSQSTAGEDTEPETAGSFGPVEIILISDMQEGSRTETLQSFDWPDDVSLVVRRVTVDGPTNARAVVLTAGNDANDEDDRMRIRVSNSEESSASQFRVAWGNGTQLTSELPVQVVPGESTVVRMPKPTPDVTSLVLSGDDHGFDNTHFIVAPRPVSLQLLFVGGEATDPRESLSYYLDRVPLASAFRDVAVKSVRAEELTTPIDKKQSPLVVVASPLSVEASEMLREYIRSGGRVLFVLSDPEQADAVVNTCNVIAGSDLRVDEAEVDDYAMLSRIRFSHPLFEPMADPQFNDFSKIRFWSHRSVSNLDVEGANVAWETVATFDDGDPALIETRIDEGHLWLLTTGWQPSDSQLAVSTKFIPLIYRFFDYGSGGFDMGGWAIGETIDLEPSDTATITAPTGVSFDYQSTADVDAIDQPGVYQWSDEDRSQRFAINLDEMESRTLPIADDDLERFGVALGNNLSTEQAQLKERQLQDQELESKQRIWQWLIVAALGLIGVELWLGSRLSGRPKMAPE